MYSELNRLSLARCTVQREGKIQMARGFVCVTRILEPIGDSLLLVLYRWTYLDAIQLSPNPGWRSISTHNWIAWPGTNAGFSDALLQYIAP